MYSEPRSITYRKFGVLFQALWKEDLPFGELGYLSVVDFVSALPDIVHVDRPNPKGDWLLTDATQQKPEQGIGLIQKQQFSHTHK